MKNQYTPYENMEQIRKESERFLCEMETEFLIHELKDPLAVIESGMNLLLKKQDKFGPYSKGLKKILKRTLRNTHKASDMLYGLLEVGRSQSGHFVISEISMTDLAYSVLSESLELLPPKAEMDKEDLKNPEDMAAWMESRGIRVTIEPEVYQVCMWQDEIKLRQILGNLIKNALHYMDHSLNLVMKTSSGELCIHVMDDGPGIDPDQQELIFRRYAQAKHQAPQLQRSKHGLGLAGARIMARCLGGDITIRSKKGEGTDFQLRLPLKFKK